MSSQSTSFLRSILNRILRLQNFKNYDSSDWVTLLLLISLITFPILSFDYGISADERVAYEYGQKIIKYYESFGADKEVAQMRKRYGGLFDITTTLLSKVFTSWDPYSLRHFVNSFFGLLAILATTLLARHLGGWKVALFALLIFLVSPRFIGHMMNNTKDVPFAAMYVLGLLGIFRIIRDPADIKAKDILLTLVGIAGAINVRAGGMLLIGWLLAFGVVEWIWVKFIQRSPSGWMSLLKIMGLAIAAYFCGLIFWPYGIEDPIRHPLGIVQQLESLPIRFKLLFDGNHISNHNLPWNYTILWIAITTPILSLLGLLLFLGSFWKDSDFKLIRHYVYLILTSIFPIAYAIYNNSVLYDGWRHFLFIYPGLVVISALGWSGLMKLLPEGKLKYVGLGLFALLWIIPAWYSVSKHPHQASYFNESVGGLSGAYGRFETDYYMNSIKHASEWLKEELKKKESEKQEGVFQDEEYFTVATNCIDPVRHYFKDMSDKVKVVYVRHSKRDQKNWDYAIFNSRYVNKEQLKNKSWPMQGTMHEVKAGDVPLAIVVRRQTKEDLLGWVELNKETFSKAVYHYERAAKIDPRNEVIWHRLAKSHYLNGNYPASEIAISKTLELYPDKLITLDLLGGIYIMRGKNEEAVKVFQRMIDADPTYAKSYNNVAIVFKQEGLIDRAIEWNMKAIEADRFYFKAYEDLMNLYQLKGDYAETSRIWEDLKLVKSLLRNRK